MRSGRKTIPRRLPNTSGLELLEAHLKVTDEAAWYAERLERLGVAMFGELWRSDESKPTNKNQETP